MLPLPPSRHYSFCPLLQLRAPSGHARARRTPLRGHGWLMRCSAGRRRSRRSMLHSRRCRSSQRWRSHSSQGSRRRDSLAGCNRSSSPPCNRPATRSSSHFLGEASEAGEVSERFSHLACGWLRRPQGVGEVTSCAAVDTSVKIHKSSQSCNVSCGENKSRTLGR